MKSWFPKPLTSTPTCYAFALLTSCCNSNGSSLIKYVPIVSYFHLTYSTMCTKWLKVGMSDMQMWTEEVVLESNKTFFLCFSLCKCIFYDRTRKQFLHILEIEFVDIFYPKFQLVSTFSICSTFCVENWLLCCDLSCKWVGVDVGGSGNELFIYSAALV